MKTELDKCMAGEWYDCHDPIFITQKGKTRQLLARYNALPYEEKKTKQEVLKEMFGSIGNNVSVGTPFLCDYGCNIHIGDNVSVNMNCSFIDCNKITIGSHVLIASNVQLYTATHSTKVYERIVEDWGKGIGICKTYALPIKIGNGAWIGGGAIILPGVTIGKNSVIGAGSVVTHSIPDNCVAVGNPCRVIKHIDNK